MTNEVTVNPVRDVSLLEQADSLRDLFTGDQVKCLRLPPMWGYHTVQDYREFDSFYLSIPNGRMIFGHDVLYCTQDLKFFPECYPKDWPYRQFHVENSESLCVDLDQFPVRQMAGTWYAPANVPTAIHLYHNLVDNYCRMLFAAELPTDLPVSIPIPVHSPLTPDTQKLHEAFTVGRSTELLPPGIYEFERLIIPPLGNKNDYMFAETTRYLREVLAGVTKRQKKYSYGTRIYVSRADTNVRNLSNETELVEELRKLGFLIMCPGQFSILTQLEIFAAAEIIVGIHGMGLMPMLVSEHCKAVFEYEAYNWLSTSFSGFAAVLDIPYEALPCRMIDPARSGMFDWLGEADIPTTVRRVREVLGIIASPAT